MAFRCPTCKHDALPREQNPSFPFCSVRCREIDLGRWLGEEYRIADTTTSVEGDEDGLSTSGADGHDEHDEPNQ